MSTGRRGYARMNHAAWVKSNLRPSWEMSEFGCKVADIVGYVGGGIYNAPININNVRWDRQNNIAVTWNAELANFDRFDLSALWVLCHRQMVRVAIQAVAPRRLRLLFSQRDTREGGTMERLPDCEEMISLIDSDFLQSSSTKESYL